MKYHRTFSTYMNVLVRAGFTIREGREPVTSDEMLKRIPEMKGELRRPMFIIFSAEK